MSKVQEDYDKYIEYAHDVASAMEWAKDFLMRREGEGHSFHLHISPCGAKFQCSFSKSEWAGDHCGEPMHEAEEAIVMAVCEYINGV